MLLVSKEPTTGREGRAKRPKTKWTLCCLDSRFGGIGPLYYTVLYSTVLYYLGRLGHCFGLFWMSSYILILPQASSEAADAKRRLTQNPLPRPRTRRQGTCCSCSVSSSWLRWPQDRTGRGGKVIPHSSIYGSSSFLWRDPGSFCRKPYLHPPRGEIPQRALRSTEMVVKGRIGGSQVTLNPLGEHRVH